MFIWKKIFFKKKKKKKKNHLSSIEIKWWKVYIYKKKSDLSDLKNYNLMIKKNIIGIIGF